MRLRTPATPIAFSLAVALCACSSGGGATPAAPISTATSSPSGPSAAEVLRRYAAAATPGKLNGHVTLHESIGFDGQELAVDAEVDLAGDAFSSVANGTALGSQKDARLIRVDGRTYSRTGAGPWIVDPSAGEASPAPGNGVPQAYTVPAETLQSQGTVDHGGQTAYRFTAAVADVLSTITATQGLTDVTGTYELLVASDGLPIEANFSGGWTQQGANGPIHVTADLRLAFRELGVAPTIEAPTDVWRMYTSQDLEFEMAHPDGWTEHADEAGGGMRFIDADGSQELRVYATTEVRYDLSQDAWLNSVIGNYREYAGNPEATEPISAAGLDSEVLAYHLTVSGSLRLFLDVPLKPHSTGFDVQWLGDPGNEEIGRGLLNVALTTLHIEET
jgi:hypothetical protein